MRNTPFKTVGFVISYLPLYCCYAQANVLVCVTFINTVNTKPLKKKKPVTFFHRFYHLSYNTHPCLERFSIECRKTKTKPITYKLDHSANLEL